MANISDLIETLASALGLPHRLVEETAHHLREAKMLPDGEDAQATVEHAGVLLLALMAAPVPKAAPGSVETYNQLPLEQATVGGFMPDGRYEGERLAGDDLLLQDLNDLGETFGEFLDGLIWALTETPDAMPVPARITVGGGPGTTYATVDFLVSAGGIDRGCMVRFGLAGLGAGAGDVYQGFVQDRVEGVAPAVPLRREDILHPLLKALNVPLYQGRIKSKKFLGF